MISDYLNNTIGGYLGTSGGLTLIAVLLIAIVLIFLLKGVRK